MTQSDYKNQWLLSNKQDLEESYCNVNTAENLKSIPLSFGNKVVPHIIDMSSSVNLMNFQRYLALKSEFPDIQLGSHKSSIRVLNDPSIQVGVMGEFYYKFVINNKTQIVRYLVITSTKELFDRKCAILCGNDAALLGFD